MRRKFRIEGQQISDRCLGFDASTEMSAGRRHYEVGPEESGYVHTVRALESLLVLAFVEVIPEWSEVHPARMVGIQFHRAAHDCGASLELAGVNDLQSQDPERVGVERIKGHSALGSRTKRREVPSEEVHLGKRNECELVRPIQLNRAPARSQCPIERGCVSLETKRVFVDVDLREAGPHVRLPIVPLRNAQQPALERRVGRRRDLFAVGEILKLPLNRREIDVVLLPHRSPHRMHEHTVAIGYGCDDAASDVVLHRKNCRRLEVPIVSLRPKLRSSFSVDELSAHSND